MVKLTKVSCIEGEFIGISHGVVIPLSNPFLRIRWVRDFEDRDSAYNFLRKELKKQMRDRDIYYSVDKGVISNKCPGFGLAYSTFERKINGCAGD